MVRRFDTDKIHTWRPMADIQWQIAAMGKCVEYALAFDIENSTRLPVARPLIRVSAPAGFG